MHHWPLRLALNSSSACVRPSVARTGRRTCACGGRPGPTGECAACRRTLRQFDADEVGRSPLGGEHAGASTLSPAATFTLPPLHEPVLQRLPDDAPASPDAEPSTSPSEERALLFLMDPQFETQAKLFAAGGEVRQVQSVEEMVTVLQTVPYKITTLYVLAHSLANGGIKFPDDSFVDATTLSGKLQGAIPAGHEPATLDFRGCSIGMDPKSMNALRTAVGADSVVGTTCFMNLFRGPAVTVSGKVITRRSQLKTDTEKAVFRREFKTLPGKFGAMAKCIVDRTESGYFAAGGHLVVAFTTKTLNEGFDPERATCLNELTTTTLSPQQAEAGSVSGSEHCRLVRIDATAAPPAGADAPSATAPSESPEEAPAPSPTPSAEERE